MIEANRDQRGWVSNLTTPGSLNLTITAAKINAVEPYLYLRSVLSRLPESDDPEDYRMFLPWNIDKALLLDFDSGYLS